MATEFYTTAAKSYAEALTKWLQTTRLTSEAIYRLYTDYQRDRRVEFNQPSWPKPVKLSEYPLSAFSIHPIPLAQRMDELLKVSWKTQFVLLEALWEEYLQDLVLELRHKDASIFEPFCEREFMALLVRDVLTGELQTIEDIKDEAATRFATGITRQSWRDQWKQLRRLEVGLTDVAEKEPWFTQLDIYFELRNCIIHRNGKISGLLNQKTDHYKTRGKTEIEIWPNSLDFFRRQFLGCLRYIEERIRKRFAKTTAGRTGIP